MTRQEIVDKIMEIATYRCWATAEPIALDTRIDGRVADEVTIDEIQADIRGEFDVELSREEIVGCTVEEVANKVVEIIKVA